MNPGSNRALIVEDEPQLASLLEDYLTQAGFSVSIIQDGNEVVAYVRENTPEIILLDLMLPGEDGMSLCRGIRSFSSVPIIMITARVEEIDRLLGLELGADDYICKPFSPREVVARVKAVLRRVDAKIDYQSAISLDESRYCLVRQEREVELTAVEFELFRVLFEEPGRIYSRSRLMDHIYRDHRIVSDRTIDSHIKKLRKKLAHLDPGNEYIHSVYGVGYKYQPG